MNELLTAWGPLGVGGILAAMMFWFYREDRKDSQAHLEALIAQQIEQSKAYNEVQWEHIRLLAELKAWLQASRM